MVALQNRRQIVNACVRNLNRTHCGGTEQEKTGPLKGLLALVYYLHPFRVAHAGILRRSCPLH